MATYLDSLGSQGSGPVSIAGSTYGHSISTSLCTIYSDGSTTYSWSLGGKYATLRGTVGQDDGSDSKTDVATVTAAVDGRVVWSRTVRYGAASRLSATISGGQRLTITVNEVSCGEGGAAAALGAIRVIS